MIERSERIAFYVFVFSFIAVIILFIMISPIGITGKAIENVPTDNELSKASEEVSCSSLECEFGCESGKCITLVDSYTYRTIVGFKESEKTTIIIETTPLYQPPVETHELGDINIEKSIEVLKDEKTFFSVSGNEYFIILKESNPTQATFEISGISEQVTIIVSETEDIDLTGDGNKEISLKIKSINIISNKVKLILTQ
ncbi:hypothetical protein J4416_00270 [Candidatus Pacearchaeota archaeon]|nr:hypothetical protein [Candidatus Pacearchaeota archaeon]